MGLTGRPYASAMLTPLEPSTQSRPLRVLVLSWRDEHHPEAGGAEVYLQRVTSALAARGHHITMQAARFPGSLHQESLDGRVVQRRGGRYSVYAHGLGAAIRSGHRYDVILDVQNGVPFWAPLGTKTPVVTLVHHVHREQWAQVFDQRRAALGWFLERKVAPVVYRHCGVITVSQSTRRELIGLGFNGDHIHIANPGIDPPIECHPVDPVAAPGPVLVVVGRLVPHKRVEIALGTVKRLSNKFPELRLEVLGHGYWEGELRRIAENMGISDRVRFAGYVSEQEKTDVMAKSRLALLPSLKEGWGLVILEAAALGVPTVAFRAAGGVTESIVEDYTGVVVGNQEEFEVAVERLLRDDNERRRLSENARAHAANFLWDRTASEVERVLANYSRKR